MLLPTRFRGTDSFLFETVTLMLTRHLEHTGYGQPPAGYGAPGQQQQQQGGGAGGPGGNQQMITQVALDSVSRQRTGSPPPAAEGTSIIDETEDSSIALDSRALWSLLAQHLSSSWGQRCYEFAS